MGRGLYVLDFDIEARPGHWIGGDYVSKVITAVAWSWEGKDSVTVLTHYDSEPWQMADELAAQFEIADVVTGHYIRGFDLPLVNGELLRAGYGPLSQVTASDTKQDLLTAHGRSKSQKNLAAMLGLSEPKVDVTLEDWEGFNSKEPGYKDAGIDRVTGDVIQHKALRSKLIELGWLGAPRVWRPNVSSGGRYMG